MLETITNGIKTATTVGIQFIALAIILQIIFGGNVPFIGGDVVGTIIGIVNQLGAQGLVGLVAAVVLFKIFEGNK